ncbi:hypothetical protein FSP39_002515 [Pinctada imbricata]|uniref:DUF6589 domain-containing protein n=1 Tax=Pinctada imbricata TaxID=66713 RepID=A0AA88Y8M6_PINIB|nr:hypothetical protein FSP39_002515 [Pinctada imbricata]
MDACAPLIPANIKVATKDRKCVIRDEIVFKMMEMFGYNEGDTSLPNGDHDELFNYSCQLCQWGTHFLALDDTAKEGDIMRILPNLLKCIPFFYMCFTHTPSYISKYLMECVDIILKCESSSPLTRIRILEGFFVNRKGGHGNNVEADLMQEHSVRHQKELIRALGANKSDRAILRAKGAANLDTSLVENYDTALSVPIKGSNHGTCTNEKDMTVIRECLRSTRPFKHTPGRQCTPHKFVHQKFKVNVGKLLIDLKVIIDRLSYGLIDGNSHEEDEHGENDGLPDI